MRKAGHKLLLTEVHGTAHHTPTSPSVALTAATSNSMQAWAVGIAGGQFADDCFYHGPAGTVADNWKDLKAKLKEAALEPHDKKERSIHAGDG